jgi:hypothetical protein
MRRPRNLDSRRRAATALACALVLATAFAGLANAERDTAARPIAEPKSRPELAPPGACAEPRDNGLQALATPPVPFEVSGTPSSRFVPGQVAASITPAMAVPRPEPPGSPARVACDEPGSGCQGAIARGLPPIIEPPVVGTGGPP